MSGFLGDVASTSTCEMDTEVRLPSVAQAQSRELTDTTYIRGIADEMDNASPVSLDLQVSCVLPQLDDKAKAESQHRMSRTYLTHADHQPQSLNCLHLGCLDPVWRAAPDHQIDLTLRFCVSVSL